MTRRRTIGIVDYGVGNIASLHHAVRVLGYACKTSHDPEVLDRADVLMLPGVAAFPAAMNALHGLDLVSFLLEAAKKGKPILGICIGMQLLSDSSTEIHPTAGLGLIPGRVDRLCGGRFHIGWNTIETVRNDPMFRRGDRRAVYFNHSYALQVPPEYQVLVTRLGDSIEPLVAGIRRDNVVGLQFHPEKSQVAGRQLLQDAIEGLLSA